MREIDQTVGRDYAEVSVGENAESFLQRKLQEENEELDRIQAFVIEPMGHGPAVPGTSRIPVRAPEPIDYSGVKAKPEILLESTSTPVSPETIQEILRIAHKD